MLQTELRTAWISTGNKPALTKMAQLGQSMTLNLWHKPDLSMKERLRRAEYMDKACGIMSNLQNSSASGVFPPGYFYRCEQLQIALDALEVTALNSTRLTLLPSSLTKPSEPAGPKISAIVPSIVWRDKDTAYWLLVTNLTTPDDGFKVTVGGRYCAVSKPVVAPKMGTLIQATLPAFTFGSMTNSTNSLEFVVVGKEGQATKTLPVTLQGKLNPEANASVTRDSNGKVLGIDVKRGEAIDDKQVLDALKEILEKSEHIPDPINFNR
jgi:hypothetical protein